MQLPELKIPEINTLGLQLNPIKVNEEYLKEWNERLNDFMLLTYYGQIVNNSLYRIGGINNPKLNEDKYFMLLKYVEDYYDNEILKNSKNKDPKHLSGRWTILDSKGNEKIVFDKFKTPYIISDSIFYSLDGYIYNIETGECYGSSRNTLKSKDFLFLDNTYAYFEIDENKKGILKVNKQDGTFEQFK